MSQRQWREEEVCIYSRCWPCKALCLQHTFNRHWIKTPLYNNSMAGNSLALWHNSSVITKVEVNKLFRLKPGIHSHPQAGTALINVSPSDMPNRNSVSVRTAFADTQPREQYVYLNTTFTQTERNKVINKQCPGNRPLFSFSCLHSYSSKTAADATPNKPRTLLTHTE